MKLDGQKYLGKAHKSWLMVAALSIAACGPSFAGTPSPPVAGSVIGFGCREGTLEVQESTDPKPHGIVGTTVFELRPGAYGKCGALWIDMPEPAKAAKPDVLTFDHKGKVGDGGTPIRVLAKLKAVDGSTRVVEGVIKNVDDHDNWKQEQVHFAVNDKDIIKEVLIYVQNKVDGTIILGTMSLKYYNTDWYKPQSLDTKVGDCSTMDRINELGKSK